MKPLLIVKLGDTHADIAATLGDFEHWFIDGLGPITRPVQVVDPRQGEPLPDAATLAGAILTGSHSMVSEREPWSEQTAHWLRQAVPAGLPVLGVCYGHQLLAHAMGGEVDYHPQGIELGTISVELAPEAQTDPLLQGLPATFGAQSAHRQSVRRLPDGAVPLAGNPFEPHHAFRIGPQAWGVQFHPEFSAAATQAYVRAIGPGEPPRVADTPEAASLLPRFAALLDARA